MKGLIIILAFVFTSLSNAQYISGDDKLHFGAGFLISSGTYTLVYLKTKNKKKAFWYSIAASSLAGLSKEIYDGHIINGRFDTGEGISTAIGGLTASTTFNLFVGNNRKNNVKNVVLVN
ncbi:MAG: hypothetical protein P8K68_12530 [Algibacter sp.]|uniref:hypothetical protein n=1 Tax=Algibacter sp. TaxID=1872428 RepID=UPI002618DC31|nr:hypothetical protein [Algibacter sp.]MDG1731085.1 hypothetical protein [Algibacter sp.]MDG2179592.1 hypothetical protein [Algibacter sp.]